jgi:hypothetical protein
VARSDLDEPTVAVPVIGPTHRLMHASHLFGPDAVVKNVQDTLRVIVPSGMDRFLTMELIPRA